MNTNRMPTAYNPGEFEDRIYKQWKEGGCFAPKEGGGEPFVIVIPPPNVTGMLHMGHGLNNTLQDFLIRYWRMKGRPALWVPGSDHAGIATQNVVERRLKERNQNRHSLGKEKFLEETWRVKEEHHGIISRQLETIGTSCDWGRERFTMDEGCSRAVREVFVSLHERGLIYRGEYLVNWCPSCGTALADDEVVHEEKKGGLWEIDYPLADGSGVLTVTTTRPETMFGDTAVAVHPRDTRYENFIGKTVILPISKRKIPIIADTYVEREFGTGCLKVTPAHDTNDYEIGRRHGLEMLSVLNSDGTMNSTAPEFVQGMPVKQARKATVEKLESLGVLRSHKEHIHQVGHCYRCSVAVEPFLSEQWFVRMKPLAKKALAAWQAGEVVFYPRKWENTYRNWLENLRDWCVSRQIWWGHQIPAWTCGSCGKLHVLREDPERCADCGGELTRDPDVLDTWFSSWLWPFSTLGWPDKTPDLARFYPTTTLVTAYDIIFFWVARMIMAGLEFTNQVPFRDIYITGLIRDKLGRKMSKSLNNGIDPMEVVNTYGADALKFTLVYLSAQGEDIPLDMETCRLGSKFANKVWNAARFVLINCKEGVLDNLSPKEEMEKSRLNLADRWIRSRFNETVKKIERAMKTYRFDEMAHTVYEYFWNDYCDWYIEAAKMGLYGEDEDEKCRTAAMQMQMLEESLKLLHPFLPFVTEEIWSKLPARRELLITASYPQVNPAWADRAAETSFSGLQKLVTAIRTLRSEFTIPPSRQIKVRIEITDENAKHLEQSAELAAKLVRAGDLVVAAPGDNHEGAIAAVGKGFTAHVYIKDAIDIDSAIARFLKSVKKTKKLIEAKKKKLANLNFTSRAPKYLIDREKAQLADMEDRAKRSMDYLSALERR